MRWLILALIVIAAVAGYAWLRGRLAGPPSTRRPAGRRPARRPPARPGAAPRPGEIWWADVPYEDGTGSKVRPCLVLRSRRGGYQVLKITSQDQRRRADHVEIPTRAWDRGADHNSFLDLTGPIFVATGRFDNHAGDLDATIWRKVRRLHRVGG